MSAYNGSIGASLPALPSASLASGFGRARTFLGAAWARFKEMRRLQRDLAYLEGADARMLRDIGLDRSEVERAVRFGRDV